MNNPIAMMQGEIYYILQSLGFKIIPKYILREYDEKTLKNLLSFAYFVAKKSGRTDLIHRGI